MGAESGIQQRGRKARPTRVIEDDAVRWVLAVLPWVILAVVVVALGAADSFYEPARTTTAGIAMYSSGMAAVALSFLTFQVLAGRIPETFRSLRNRNLIGLRPAAGSGERAGGEDTSSPPASVKPSALAQEEYATFVDDVFRLLNHPGQWAMGAAFTLLVLTWLSRFTLMPPPYVDLVGLVVYVGLVVEFVIALAVGLMAWRMAVLGWQIWRLGRKFDVTPQLGHPDGCGGLEPLGNLCLWNALIVSIAGIYLGGWIIVGPSTSYRSVAIIYAPLFTRLLVVPMVVAAVSFFLPLWSLHQTMVAKREELQSELDQLAKAINDLERELLERADELAPEQSEGMARRLQVMRETYQRGQRYPVWPFNLGILLKLASSQAVPLLGITGLGEPTLKAIKAVIDILGQVEAR